MYGKQQTESSTMYTFQTAAALANSERNAHPDITRFYHSSILETPITTNQKAIPQILGSLFKSMAEFEPEIEITTLANDNVTTIDKIPKHKATFDTMFNVSTKKTQKVNFHQTFFIIKSKRPMGVIKNDSWTFLKNNNLWLRRNPGNTNHLTMTPIGFLSGIPKDASLISLKSDIDHLFTITKREESKRNQYDINENDNMEIHLERARVTGHIKNSTISGHTTTVVYTAKDNIDTTKDILQKFSQQLELINTTFVPFSLRKHNQTAFGQLLNESISTTDKINNVALFGISPEVMDFNDYDNNITSLWDSLHDLEGVVRVDSHRRTSDLGKWHVSVHHHLLETTKTTIDNLIHDMIINVPMKLLQQHQFTDFPEPTRLQHRSTVSIATSNYYDWLIDRCDTNIPVPEIIEQPTFQRPTAKSLSYSQMVTFQDDNKSQRSINSNNSTNSQKTTHNSEHNVQDSLTEDLSTITASTVKNMIDDALTQHQNQLTEDLQTFHRQHQQTVTNIETKIKNFQQHNETTTKQNNEKHQSDMQQISLQIQQTNSDTKKFFEHSIQELRHLIIAQKTQTPRSPLSPLHKKNKSSQSPASTNTSSTYSSHAKSYVTILAKDLTPSFDASISKKNKQQE